MEDDSKFKALEERKKGIEKRLNLGSAKEEEVIENLTPRAGRNIKIQVTDDLPKFVTEEEYRILEKHTEDEES